MKRLEQPAGMTTAEEKGNMERKYGNVCITRVPKDKLFVHMPRMEPQHSLQNSDENSNINYN